MKTWLGALLVGASWVMVACNARVVVTPDEPFVPVPTPDPTPSPAPTPPVGDPVKPRCGGPAIEVLDPATSSGYDVSSYTASDLPGAGEVEVHVIGVYETRSDHSADYHPRGVGSVNVTRPGRHVIVLSSYEPTDFTVTAEPGATIERVILNGYEHHTVKAPAGATIDDRSGVGSYLSACAYKWPGDDQGCDTKGLVEGVETLVGRKVTTFTGIYRATKFVIGSDGTACPSAPKIDLAGECTSGYRFTSYAAEEASAPSLVLLGKYESDSRHSAGYHPTGTTVVHVAASSSPIVLALSSYEPTEWVLDAAPGASISRIILNGYHDQSIRNAGDIPVDTYDQESSLGGYAYAWPSTSGGSDTQGLVKALESKTGLKLAAFGGCYQATAFSVSAK